jgi:hypothetical protein
MYERDVYVLDGLPRTTGLIFRFILDRIFFGYKVLLSSFLPEFDGPVAVYMTVTASMDNMCASCTINIEYRCQLIPLPRAA